MDIPSGPRGAGRVWHHVERGFAALAVWTERIPGRGEDADPLVLFHRPAGRGLLSVFDGVGGAGRAAAGHGRQGTVRTQAWVASRRLRGLVEEWFAAGMSAGLRERIAARLAVGAPGRGRVRGSIPRGFPTTFAALTFDLAFPNVAWVVHWAGDSRCYVAEPDTGLQQLSRDDTECQDALELLVQDPPMTNVVCSDRPFEINSCTGSAVLPCLLICATDGFFGYVETPAQFEQLLWETLLSAQDILHWSGLLAERVVSYTGDDASLAVVGIGFEDFDALRASFRQRADFLDGEHTELIRQVRPGDQAGLVAARETSWHRYRPDYERRLPERGSA
jgi:hypothetical protein